MTTPEIVRWVIDHFEGFAYTDDPVDAGGSTKFGITQRTLQYYRRQVTGNPALVVTKADVAGLSIDEAMACGVRVFAVEPKIDRLADWRTRLIVYDYGFHSGQPRAIQALQTAVGATPDGVLGPLTLELVGAMPNWQTALRVLTSREEFMDGIFTKRPAQKKYMHGWFRRTTTLQRVLCQ